MSTIIEEIVARKTFNSRGETTLEVDISTMTGFGRTSAPSGASKGKSEITPYPKGGVDQAIKKINEEVSPELVGFDAERQEEIDSLLHEIDGTENFRNIGGNSAYAVSLASAEAAANSHSLPLFKHLGGNLVYELPNPLGNVLSGGMHTNGTTPNIQEFLVLPVGASSFFEAAQTNVYVHQKVGALLRKRSISFLGGRSDEGAWTCALKDEDALQVVSEACEYVSEARGIECRVGVDMAASTLWNPEKKSYVYSDKKRSIEEQMNFVEQLIEEYNLIYVEDPFHEEDFESFSKITKEVGEKCLICGDDLFTTNSKRLKKGVNSEAANSIVIKLNQVGTLSDTWTTVRKAKENGYIPITSHRSGDTEYPQIVHLAVAFQTPIVKVGVVEGTRVTKINELIRIEEILGDRAELAMIKNLKEE